jgi:uncharacterized protein
MTCGSSPLAVDLSRVPEDGLRLRVPARDIELPTAGEVTFPGDIDVAVTVEDIAGGTLLHVEAAGTAVAECFRCLEPYQLRLETSVEFLYRTGEGREDGDGVLHLDPHHPVIALGPPVRESLLLELPMTRICTPGCGGLCPGCGANLNNEECRCRQT